MSTDQIGTPTYTYDLARLVVDMIQTDKYGIYHVTNEGDYISWYDFTLAIFETAGITHVTVNPVTSVEYGAAAKRPYNSRSAGLERCPVPLRQDSQGNGIKYMSCPPAGLDLLSAKEQDRGGQKR